MKNHNSKKLKPLLRWHRRIGIVAALGILLVSVTGLLLNHSQTLQLDRIMLNNSWVLNAYDMQPDSAPRSYAAGDTIVSFLENTLYLDGAPVAPARPVLGSVEWNDRIVVATEDRLFLFTSTGELIEALDSASLPGHLIQVGLNRSQSVLIQTDQGVFQFDQNLMTTEPYAGEGEWSKALATTPPDVLEKILTQYRGQGVSLYRVILDLHSGRILTRIGPWLADLVALAMIALTLTGLYSCFKLKLKLK